MENPWYSRRNRRRQNWSGSRCRRRDIGKVSREQLFARTRRGGVQGSQRRKPKPPLTVADWSLQELVQWGTKVALKDRWENRLLGVQLTDSMIQFGVHNQLSGRGVFMENSVASSPQGKWIVLNRAGDLGEIGVCVNKSVLQTRRIVVSIYTPPIVAYKSMEKMSPSNRRLTGQCELDCCRIHRIAKRNCDIWRRKRCPCSDRAKKSGSARRSLKFLPQNHHCIIPKLHGPWCRTREKMPKIFHSRTIWTFVDRGGGTGTQSALRAK